LLAKHHFGIVVIVTYSDNGVLTILMLSRLFLPLGFLSLVLDFFLWLPIELPTCITHLFVSITILRRLYLFRAFHRRVLRLLILGLVLTLLLLFLSIRSHNRLHEGIDFVVVFHCWIWDLLLLFLLLVQAKVDECLVSLFLGLISQPKNFGFKVIN